MADIGKVVRVLSPTEVVVNLGKHDGVFVGMELLIYVLGEEIEDPESQENLGRLEIVRGRGEAKHVQDRMCTVRSIEKQTRQEYREKPPDQFDRIFGGVTRNLSRAVLVPVEETAPLEGVQVGDLVRPV